LNYFKDCKTIHEAKRRFRELAKKYHPDAGGDAKTFAEISHQMDNFTPSQPEHTNFSGYGGDEYFHMAYERAQATKQSEYGQSGYRFNTSYTHSYSIPFDHPIHEEKRNLEKQVFEAQANARYFEKKYEEFKAYLKNTNDFLFEKNREMAQKNDEIAALKSQIEVLSRPQPSCSMLYKIRRFFEKPSEM